MGKKTGLSKNPGAPAASAKAPKATPSPADVDGGSLSSAPARKAPKTPTSKVATKAPPQVNRPSMDDIALRAYFIAEERQRKGLPGDATSDWVEAERALLKELNQKRPARAAKAKAK